MVRTFNENPHCLFANVPSLGRVVKKRDAFRRKENFRVLALLEATIMNEFLNPTEAIVNVSLPVQWKYGDYNASWQPDKNGSWTLPVNDNPNNDTDSEDQDPLGLNMFFSNLRAISTS